LTEYQILKLSNYLSAISLYRDRAQTARTVMANTAPYRLATGTLSLLTTGTVGRMASPVTQTPSIAVPLVQIWVAPDNLLISFYLSLSVASQRSDK